MSNQLEALTKRALALARCRNGTSGVSYVRGP
jgi:hypothetical protein